jgi:hypothetical protein
MIPSQRGKVTVAQNGIVMISHVRTPGRISQTRWSALRGRCSLGTAVTGLNGAGSGSGSMTPAVAWMVPFGNSGWTMFGKYSGRKNSPRRGQIVEDRDSSAQGASPFDACEVSCRVRVEGDPSACSGFTPRMVPPLRWCGLGERLLR